MDKKLLQQVAKQAWYYVLSYFTHYLLPIIRDAFDQAKGYFIEKLWDSVKIQLMTDVQSVVEYAEYFFDSYTYREKEKVVIDTLFKNIELPLALRPFKPLMKKILRDKLRQLISRYLKKLSSRF